MAASAHLADGGGADDGRAADDAALATATAELCRLVADGVELATVTARICERARALLDIEAAAIWTVEPGRVLPIAVEPAEMVDLQSAQAGSGRGPASECVRSGVPVEVPSISAVDGRWPEFTASCAASGITSAAALPLLTAEGVVGCLVLFGVGWSAPDAAATPTARALTGLAGVAVVAGRHRAVNCQLRGALESRVLVEQAQGLFAESLGISSERAIAALRSYARAHGLLVHEVAAKVIAGALVLEEPRG